MSFVNLLYVDADVVRGGGAFADHEGDVRVGARALVIACARLLHLRRHRRQLVPPTPVLHLMQVPDVLPPFSFCSDARHSIM
jgi:hypothetical protein